MKITLNGKEVMLQEPMSLQDFLMEKGIQPQRVVVEYNEEIVKADRWTQIVLKAEDRLEVLSFVGGG